jgi:hypothetical protein
LNTKNQNQILFIGTQKWDQSFCLLIYIVNGIRVLVYWFTEMGSGLLFIGTSFSGGRSRSTRREPPTMGKQLVSFITCGCKSSAPFLAHLAKGNVSFCHHLASVFWYKTISKKKLETETLSTVKNL